MRRDKSRLMRRETRPGSSVGIGGGVSSGARLCDRASVSGVSVADISVSGISVLDALLESGTALTETFGSSSIKPAQPLATLIGFMSCVLYFQDVATTLTQKMHFSDSKVMLLELAL